MKPEFRGHITVLSIIQPFDHQNVFVSSHVCETSKYNPFEYDWKSSPVGMVTSKVEISTSTTSYTTYSGYVFGKGGAGLTQQSLVHSGYQCCCASWEGKSSHLWVFGGGAICFISPFEYANYVPCEGSS
jgi:hypothetical protein